MSSASVRCPASRRALPSSSPPAEPCRKPPTPAARPVPALHQLETVVLACDRWANKTNAPTAGRGDGEAGGRTATRAGFYLADGTGVGKGRQVAAIALELLRTGKCTRGLWFSVSADLRNDAERDFRDLGGVDPATGRVDLLGVQAQIPLWPARDGTLPPRYSKKKAEDTDKAGGPGSLEAGGVVSGIVFCTYSTLIQGAAHSCGRLDGKPTRCADDVDAEMVMKGHEREDKETRLHQLATWAAGGKDWAKASPLIVFDECHKARARLRPRPAAPAAPGGELCPASRARPLCRRAVRPPGQEPGGPEAVAHQPRGDRSAGAAALILIPILIPISDSDSV